MQPPVYLSLIDCFKITSDVNKVDELIDLPKETYGNMTCEVEKNGD